MSEKRFCETERACYYTSLVRDTLINEKLGTDKVVDLLNSLVDENEELLKKEKHLHKVITRKDERINNLVRNKEQLKKEKENLIQKNCIPCELVNLQTREIDKLKNKNEQLHHLKVLANAFIVEKGLEVEFVKWCVEE